MLMTSSSTLARSSTQVAAPRAESAKEAASPPWHTAANTGGKGRRDSGFGAEASHAKYLQAQ